MKTLNLIIGIALGGTIGSVVTWRILKAKYEKQLQEDIQSVKEEFSKHAGPIEETSTEPVKQKEKIMSPVSYGQITMNLGYTSPEVEEDDEISIIMPDEFGQFSDYRAVNLTYYADKVLAYDEDDVVLNDVEDAVGSEFIDKFGEYEAGVVHVRNDRMMTDFEISLDTRTYKEVVGEDPVSIARGRHEK